MLRHPCPPGVAVGKMNADVTQVGSTEQRITNGMDQNICIGVAHGSFVGRHFNATQPEVSSFLQWVNIKSHTHSYFHIPVFGVVAGTDSR